MLIECALYFLTYALYFDTSWGITLQCNRTYLAKTGHWCYPCSAGYSKISECVVNDTQDRCARCKEGEYQPNCDDSTHCAHCKLFCLPGQDKLKSCTATSDLVCQCKAGSYLIPHTGKLDEGFCKAHSKCGAGEGFDRKGTPYEDTKCVPCRKGVSYSDNISFDTCLLCTVCNTTTVAECTATSDTVCDDQFPQRPTQVSTAKNLPMGSDGDVVVAIVISVAVAVLILPGVITFLICRCKRKTSTHENTEQDKVDLSNINASGENGLENGFNATRNGAVVSGKETPKGKNLSSQKTSANDTPANDTASTDKSREGSLNSYTELQQNLEYVNDNKAFDSQSFAESVIQNEKENDTVSYRNKLQTDTSVSGGGNLEEEHIQLTGKNEDLTETSNMEYVLKNKESDSSRSGNVTNTPAGLGSNIDTLCGRKLTPGFEAIEYDPLLKSYMDNTVISADAAALSPRSSLQLDVINIQSRYHTSPREGVMKESMIGEDEEAIRNLIGGASEGERSGSFVAWDEANKKEKIWIEIFLFLANHLKWSEFHMFVIRLAANTNEKFLKRVDVKLNHAKEETQSCTNSIYDVMNSWRQATPKAIEQDIYDALKECSLNLVCEDLKDTLIQRGFFGTTSPFHNIAGQNEETVRKTPWSFSEHAAHNQSEINLEMRELKGHDAEIFC